MFFLAIIHNFITNDYELLFLSLSVLFACEHAMGAELVQAFDDTTALKLYCLIIIV